MSSVERSLLHIDGRILEGGGQLLRLAVGLSVLQARPIQISHIRGNRSGGGGLKAQHLASVRWLAAACGANTEGAETRSQDLVFRPQSSPPSVVPQNYTQKDGTSEFFETRVDVGSPGSVGLVLQAVLPFVLFRPPVLLPTKDHRPIVTLTITGGTNVSNSPSYEYISQVLLPTLHSIGLPAIEAKLVRRGWSTGGSSIGSVVLTIPTLQPGEVLSSELLQNLDGIDEDQRHPSAVDATIVAPKAIHEVFTKSLIDAVQKLCGASVKLSISREDSQHEKRIYLIVVARVRSKGRECIFGSDELLQGHKGKPLEVLTAGMTERVLSQLITDVESGACVDRHMIDQLVVFQALAGGESNVGRGVSKKQSLHADTAEWVAEKMLGAEIHIGKAKGVGLIAGARANPELEEATIEMDRLVLNGSDSVE